MERRDEIRIGLLFSSSGPYATISRTMLNGARLAIDEVNADPAFPFTLAAVTADPGGRNAEYAAAAQHFLAGERLVHVVGCYTSSSRKEVLPLFEKHDALLWYVCPYEGFEANPNVIYTGACPNQHLLPLFEHLLPVYGRRVYLPGANYIWGWGMNRAAREIVAEAGGAIVGERCLPIGDTDVDRIMAEVVARRPDFILSNMLGPSNHAFLQAMRDLGQRDPAFRPEHCPVVSCDLTECELPEIGFGAADG